jgi:hypothetical protein
MRLSKPRHLTYSWRLRAEVFYGSSEHRLKPYA